MQLQVNSVSQFTPAQVREVARRADADLEAWHQAAEERGKGLRWILAWIFAGYRHPPAWLPPPAPIQLPPATRE